MDVFPLTDWLNLLRWAWACLAVMTAAAVAAVIWRMRGLLSWKRSQRSELAELRRQMESAEKTASAAAAEIVRTCEGIRRSAAPDIGHLTSLPEYWRRIAANYYPGEPQPELCLSVGQLLAVARQLADRLEALLRRPGFNRLGRLRVGQVQRTFHWYQRLTAQPVVAWMLARRRAIRTFRHAVRVVLPDPLVWIAYLSQRLTLMIVVRCVLIDLYLSTGKIAMEAFESQLRSVPAVERDKASRMTLDAYGQALEKENRSLPDALETIRSGLTGLPGRLWQPPGIEEWCRAVERAAGVIAAGYFPESPAPLKEATCRVLLDRVRHWLETMAAARRLSVVRPLYGISLKRLQQIKAVTESDLLRRTGKVAGSVWSAWRWARWPVQLLRWIRRRSPAGVALEVGSTLALKAMHNYLARYGFDRACQELDTVYRLSSQGKHDGLSDENKLNSGHTAALESPENDNTESDPLQRIDNKNDGRETQTENAFSRKDQMKDSGEEPKGGG